MAEEKKNKPKYVNEGLLKHSWKPGQSGNPAGRPKGSRNFSTILKEFINTDFPSNHEAVKKLREQFPHYFNGENENADLLKVIFLTLAKGVTSKDPKVALLYLREILDRAEGKPVAKHQIEADVTHITWNETKTYDSIEEAD